MRLSAIIIDDELPTLNLMKYIISKNKNIEIVGAFSNPREALEQIKLLKPDVAFIDVEMPGINGIALAEALEDLNYDIKIIFATAYKEYAFDAFRVEASDYILKPVTEEQVNRTVDKLIKRYPLIISKGHEKNVRAASEAEENINKSKDDEASSSTSAEDKKDQRCSIISFGQLIVSTESNSASSLSQVKFETSKVEELFAYLVLSEGRPVEKWKLCELLWADFPEKKAEHNLHSTIYRLKSSFKKAGFIEEFIKYKNGCYTLNIDLFYCDLWDFRKLEKYRTLDDSNASQIKAILDLYLGELYGNKGYLWAIDESQKLNDIYTETTMKLAHYYIDKRQYDLAIRYLSKLLQYNTYNEEVYELMMKIYFYKGDRIKLMKFYKDMQETLEKELDVKPRKTTIELYNALINNLGI